MAVHYGSKKEELLLLGLAVPYGMEPIVRDEAGPSLSEEKLFIALHSYRQQDREKERPHPHILITFCAILLPFCNSFSIADLHTSERF